MRPAWTGSPSTAVATGIALTALSRDPKTEVECGDTCIAIRIGAARSGGSARTSSRSASKPPADAPTTIVRDWAMMNGVGRGLVSVGVFALAYRVVLRGG